MEQALQDIAEERERQMSEEGWTPEHDDQHTREEMALAAACYATPPRTRQGLHSEPLTRPPYIWPWPWESWKPSPMNRRRELVKAAALLVAEIERLDRIER